MNNFTRHRPSKLSYLWPISIGNSPRSATIPSNGRLTIVEMGGFHSTMIPVSKGGEIIGGAAYVADAVTKIRQTSDPILISNGDVFTGQTSSLEDGGDFVVQFMNYLNFDAMTLGIHDFDDGQEKLVSRISKAKFPILAANLISIATGFHVSRCPSSILKMVSPYTIIERGMQTIAIMGLMKEDTPLFQSPKNLEGLKFHNAKETICYWIEDILEWKPNIIIIQYNKLSEAEELVNTINERIKAKKLKPALLVFIGGHLDEKPKQGPNYLIMQGTDRGYKLGVIKIKEQFRGSSFLTDYAVVSAKRYIPESKILKLVETVRNRIKQKDELLGHSSNMLQRHRYHDCTLGILVTESMKEISGAEVAFLSSGTLKLDIPVGPIYASNLDDCIPFKDSVVLLEMTGEKIAETLEQSAKLEADSGGSGGKILQVSGIKFKYCIYKEKGQRVSDVYINSCPIEAGRLYTAAVSRYLVEGGDGYNQFRESNVVKIVENLKESVKSYIKKQGGTLNITRDFRIEEVSN